MVAGLYEGEGKPYMSSLEIPKPKEIENLKMVFVTVNFDVSTWPFLSRERCCINIDETLNFGVSTWPSFEWLMQSLIQNSQPKK